jgi:hypothetical protein
MRGAALLAVEPEGDPVGRAVDEVESFTPSAETASQDLELCLGDEESAEIKSCTYGDARSQQVVVLAGDSHAGQWIPPLAHIAKARGWKLVTYIKPLCPFADVVVVNAEGAAPYDSCTRWNAAVKQQLGEQPAPVLFLTSNIQRDTMNGSKVVTGRAAVSALTQGLERQWAPIAGRGTPILAIGNSPWPDIDIPDCVSGNSKQLTKCAVPRTEAMSRSSSALEDAVTATPGAHYMETFSAVCPDDPCAAVIGGVLVYADSNHVTATYAASMQPRFESAVVEVVPGAVAPATDSPPGGAPSATTPPTATPSG